MKKKLWIVEITQSLKIILLIIFCSPGFAMTETVTEKLPKNAALKSYGTGWKCNPGFHRSNEDCIEVIAPENAYLTYTSYDNGWSCNWAYKKINDSCVKVILPDNAYIDATGEKWKCMRGYLKEKNTCSEIKVPKNAHFSETSYRTGWNCDRGYHESYGICIEVFRPKNSHLNYSGNNWECNKPYSKKDKSCILLRKN